MSKNIEELKEISKTLRGDIVSMLTESKSGHPGGSLSIADILAILYFKEMNIDPKNPKDENRDRFVLSKGHAAPALYSTLARRGYFDQRLNTLRRLIQGYKDILSMEVITGIDMSGLIRSRNISEAVGMALG